VSASSGRAASLVDAVRDIVGGNLVLDREGEFWAVFKLRGHTYNLKSYEGKLEIYNAIESALTTIATRVKILSLVRNFGGETYIDRLRLMNFGSAGWHEWCNIAASRIEYRAPYYRDFYLAVKLHQQPEDLKDLAEAVVRFFHKLARKLFRAPLNFSVEDYLRSRKMGSEMELNFGPRLIEGPASPEDIQYLVQRGPYRAIGEPPVAEGWRPRRFVRQNGSGLTYYEPYAQDLINLVGDIPWKADIGRLEFRHGDGVTSYQRFMCINSMPTNKLGFPGSEWAFLDLPVDLCLDFDVIPHSTAERQRKVKSRRATEQSRHALESDADLNIGLREAESADRELEALHAEGKPRLDCHATIGIAATSPQELDSLTQEVRQFYSGSELKIGVSLARSTQTECFADFLPCGPRRNPDYKQPMGSKALSGGMPVGDSSLGDGRGFYIGYPLQQQNSVVAYDPTLPMQDEDKGGACAVVGDLGSGKTMLVQCLNAMYVLAGYQCLILDPKGDSEKFKNLDDLDGMIRYIRVEPGSPTRLPILSVYPGNTVKEEKATEQLLRSFLLQLMAAGANHDARRAIQLGVRDFMNNETLRRKRVRGLLDQFHYNGNERTDRGDQVMEFSKHAAADLAFYMEDALAELVLGDEADDGEVLSEEHQEYPLTLIQTDGLHLPERQKVIQGNLTDEERISQAILSVVAASAMQMASRHRYAEEKPFKSLTFDEAWRFASNSEGQALLDYLIREGRSQNVAPYICTQKWEDIEPIVGLMPIRFMGRNQRDTADVELGLKTLGVDPSPDNVSAVKNFGKGNFVHQDVYGNAGMMHFDVTPASWITKLGSTPRRRDADRAAGNAIEDHASPSLNGATGTGANGHDPSVNVRRRPLRSPSRPD
jgi:hypothetical protein